jgi:hypothetical protein
MLLLLSISCGTPPTAEPPRSDAIARPSANPALVASGDGGKDSIVSSADAGGSSTAGPTFDQDLAFLEAHGKVIVLGDTDGGKVALSPLYQGRVMTSAVSGSGRSLGWINRTFIEAGKTGTQFDNYGGEDRFWLGPEGGQFGLYFPAGKPFTFDNWQTPQAMQTGAWAIAAEKPDHVTFQKKMIVQNWSGTELRMKIERTARILTREDAKKVLGLGALPASADGLGFVAFETKNRLENDFKYAWRMETGFPSIWILAMFAPAADARVIIPFETKAPKGTEIVNDRYFGKVPAERLAVHEDKGFLSFTCDGKERGKIGLGPARAKNVLGSYSKEAKLLTIVHYDGPKKGSPYVNSMWEKQKEPFKGDVVNAYNDGPPAPGKPPLGGFYEIETSSPGAIANKDGDSTVVHTHRTFHFVGEPAVLEPIMQKALGVSLADAMK